MSQTGTGGTVELDRYTYVEQSKDSLMSCLLIIGAGGHGVAVADAAEALQQWSEIVFLDDAYPELNVAGIWKIRGVVASLEEHCADVDAALVAIGDNEVRLSLLANIESASIRLATIIHPRATVSKLSQVGDGTMVLANAVINPRATIGKGCIINTGAIIEHDCKLADGVHVAPGATLAADVSIGAESWIGAGATVKEKTTIGSRVVVGMGAVVIRDVSDGFTVAGVPAKPI